MSLIGMDPDATDLLAESITSASSTLSAVAEDSLASIQSVDWSGPDHDLAVSEARQMSRLAGDASAAWKALAKRVAENAQRQREVSAAGALVGSAYPGSPGSPPPVGAGGGSRSDDEWWEVLLDLKKAFGAAAAAPLLWQLMRGGDVSFGLYKMALGGRIPLTAVQGRALTWAAGKVGMGDDLLRFVSSPVGQKWITGFGIAGGVVGTGLGVYDLIQQGNPVDAFRRDPAAYSAKVAGTAFSAASTAFLIAPNPVTGVLALGTGLVYAGTEVWNHWDDVTSGLGTAADWIGDKADAVIDWGEDALDSVGGFITSHIPPW